jgi:hypothetical protein
MNLGSVAGAVVGSIGGLFAVGIAPAILSRNIAALFGTPLLGLMCWLVCLPTGWLAGGQIGPRLGQKYSSPRVELLAGALAGLVPVLLIAAFGWYMAVPH